MTQSEITVLAHQSGLNPRTISGRIERGWPREMLCAPVGTVRQSYRRHDADKAKRHAFRALMDAELGWLVADAFVEAAPKWLNVAVHRAVRKNRREARKRARKAYD